MSDAAFQRTNDCDLLLAKVSAAIVRGEACCHVNDKEWDRSWWEESLEAAIRLRAMAGYVSGVSDSVAP